MAACVALMGFLLKHIVLFDNVIMAVTIIRWLWNLNEYGMCIVNNAPIVLGGVVKVCVRVCV